MFGLLVQLLLQLLLLKGIHGCKCTHGGTWPHGCKCGPGQTGGTWPYCKDKPTTKPVEQTTQRASARPHRPNIIIKWQEWGRWSLCTPLHGSCGTGVQWRRRTCKDSTRCVSEQIIRMMAMRAIWIITLWVTMMVMLMMPGNAKLAKGKGGAVQPRLAQVDL